MADYTPTREPGFRWKSGDQDSTAVQFYGKKSGEVIAYRSHPTFEARRGNLYLNELAYYGGQPYIDERLSRFPSEDDSDWQGERSNKSDGRKHRATLRNYVRRISDKTNQYVFSVQPKREGIDVDFAKDVTKTGCTINQFWEWVSTYVSLHGWCWVGCDRLATPEGGQSEAEKKARGDRATWQMLPASMVVDWKFNEAGTLTRLIIEYQEYEDEDITKPGKWWIYRDVYTDGVLTTYKIKISDGGRYKTEVIGTPQALVGGKIPFFVVGKISPKPQWTDDLERGQKSQMDLSSAYRNALIKAGFPLLILPESVMYDDTGTETATGRPAKGEIRRRIGLRYPVTERNEENGITRYITPGLADLSMIREEINAGDRDIFDTGLKADFVLKPLH